MNCKICRNNSDEIFEATVLNKHCVRYYQCNSCGFIQTEEPHWLEEAYSDAIGDLDVGLVNRNIELSDILLPIIKRNFNAKGQFLDYGGGYGLFVRLMRDRGIDFYRYDSYCENIFAKYFDIEDVTDSGAFELITAFELFEHLVNPISEIEKMLKYSDNLFFTTELQPKKSFTNSNDWWYFSVEAGQHVSFYTYKSLQILAERLGKRVYSNKANMHLFTSKKMSDSDIKMTIGHKVFNRFYRNNKNSLTQSDFDKIKEIMVNKA